MQMRTLMRRYGLEQSFMDCTAIAAAEDRKAVADADAEQAARDEEWVEAAKISDEREQRRLLAQFRREQQHHPAQRAWERMIDRLIAAEEEKAANLDILAHNNLQLYQQLRGRRVMQPYLDCTTNELGRWLKCRLRSDTADLFVTLGTRIGWLTEQCICAVCRAEPETRQHFLLLCPATEHLRSSLWNRIRAGLERAVDARAALLFDELTRRATGSDDDLMCVLLGGDTLPPRPAEEPLKLPPEGLAVIDRRVRNFLMLAWRWRNEEYGRTRIKKDDDGSYVIRIDPPIPKRQLFQRYVRPSRVRGTV